MRQKAGKILNQLQSILQVIVQSHVICNKDPVESIEESWHQELLSTLDNKLDISAERTDSAAWQAGQSSTFCLLKLETKSAERPIFLQHTQSWKAVFSLAGLYWSFPGPNSFLPCLPISHLTAFRNDLICKLFSKAPINYSISSVSQPLEEHVQSFSLGFCLLCTHSPVSGSAPSLQVSQAGSL